MTENEMLTALSEGKTIQFKPDQAKTWFDAETKDVIKLILQGGAVSAQGHALRVKPETIHINGVPVPVPEQKPLNLNDYYFIPALNRQDLVTVSVWKDDKDDNRILKRGLVHKTEEAAKQHALALISHTEAL